MENEINSLKEVGLTETESKVYLALLGEGELIAGPLSKKAGIHRKNVYDALEGLLKKGLISVVEKNKKRYWTSLSPKRIRDILKEKDAKIEQIMPSLLSKQGNQLENRKVTYYDGLEGMKTFLNDILNSEKELLIQSGTGEGYSKMGFFIFPWFKKLNQQKKPIRVLFNPNVKNKGQIIKEISKIRYRTLPMNFSSATQLFIYGYKTGILIWSENPLCMLINNKEITLGFKKHFEALWKIAKK